MNKMPNADGRSQIHIAATFFSDSVKGYDREGIQEYMETMLDEEDVVYTSVVTIEGNSDRTTVQCKLAKATISKTMIDIVEDIYRGMDGHIETWVSTESVLGHPEVYK